MVREPTSGSFTPPPLPPELALPASKQPSVVLPPSDAPPPPKPKPAEPPFDRPFAILVGVGVAAGLLASFAYYRGYLALDQAEPARGAARAWWIVAVVLSLGTLGVSLWGLRPRRDANSWVAAALGAAGGVAVAIYLGKDLVDQFGPERSCGLLCERGGGWSFEYLIALGTLAGLVVPGVVGVTVRRRHWGQMVALSGIASLATTFGTLAVMGLSDLSHLADRAEVSYTEKAGTIPLPGWLVLLSLALAATFVRRRHRRDPADREPPRRA